MGSNIYVTDSGEMLIIVQYCKISSEDFPFQANEQYQHLVQGSRVDWFLKNEMDACHVAPNCFQTPISNITFLNDIFASCKALENILFYSTLGQTLNFPPAVMSEPPLFSRILRITDRKVWREVRIMRKTGVKKARDTVPLTTRHLSFKF